MSDKVPPIPFQWDGEAMVPQHPKMADRYYVVGQQYRLVEENERSQRSHAHYFACVNEAWKNLPEADMERFPTAEHLRKRALIDAGFRQERLFPASSKAEALRIAAFLKPTDEFAVVFVRDNVVVEWKAESQSMRAMGKDRFQESKDAVLEALAAMARTTPAELKQHAANAA